MIQCVTYGGSVVVYVDNDYNKKNKKKSKSLINLFVSIYLQIVIIMIIASIFCTDHPPSLLPVTVSDIYQNGLLL